MHLQCGGCINLPLHSSFLPNQRTLHIVACTFRRASMELDRACRLFFPLDETASSNATDPSCFFQWFGSLEGQSRKNKQLA